MTREFPAVNTRFDFFKSKELAFCSPQKITRWRRIISKEIFQWFRQISNGKTPKLSKGNRDFPDQLMIF